MIINKKATYMFDNLSERLERSFKILKGEGKITEINVAETLKDVRRALLDADVNYKVAKNFTDTVKEKALGQNVLTAVKPSQLMVKIVHDELTTLMGGDTAEIELKGRPAVILMSGLQGSGKTTFSGKLARMMKSKKNRKPLLVACDVYRPAAITQLQINGEKQGVEVFSMGDKQNPVNIAKAAVEHAKSHGFNVVILDTAGRLHVDEAMMEELQNIKEAVHVDQTILVVDAMTGQDAVNVADSFNQKLELDGVILTKLDGDTRGGAALSIKATCGKPILYVGMGEKLSDLEQFYPERMASRILGMGDVMTLIEKAQANIDEDKAREMEQKLKKAQFGFDDYLESMAQVKNMGGISSILSMMPGIGNKAADIEAAVDESKMARIEAIILSMTPKERSNPDLLNPSRKKRIAKGAGVDISEVNKLVKQFEQTRKMMKQFPGMMGGKGAKRGRFKLPF